MSDAKTLVILTPGFPSDESDTTCLPARQMFLLALKRNNPALNIVVLAFQYPFFDKTYNWNGIRVIAFNGRNKSRLSRFMVWLRVWRSLQKIKRENNIIGILSFWLGECALLGNYFGKRNKIKHLTWLLGQDARKGNKYVKLVKPTAENLIALSDFIAAEFDKNYHIQPAHVIPVGVDVSMFAVDVHEKTMDVLGAGSLIPLKQYDVFINIVKSLTEFFPHLSAVICGKGPEKQNLLRQIETLGLQKNIRLLDEIPHPEVLRLMQRSKVFLHTSSYEGFGSVCAEALYAGAHVVSFCKPMNMVAGHSYNVNTAEQMSDKIQELLNNATLDHKPVLLFSAAEVADRMIKLFLPGDNSL